MQQCNAVKSPIIQIFSNEDIEKTYNHKSTFYRQIVLKNFLFQTNYCSFRLFFSNNLVATAMYWDRESEPMQSNITACSTGQSANHLHHRGDEWLAWRKFCRMSFRNRGLNIAIYSIIIYMIFPLINHVSMASHMRQPGPNPVVTHRKIWNRDAINQYILLNIQLWWENGVLTPLSNVVVIKV